jgi:hypothetical protein
MVTVVTAGKLIITGGSGSYSIAELMAAASTTGLPVAFEAIVIQNTSGNSIRIITGTGSSTTVPSGNAVLAGTSSNGGVGLTSAVFSNSLIDTALHPTPYGSAV